MGIMCGLQWERLDPSAGQEGAVRCDVLRRLVEQGFLVDDLSLHVNEGRATRVASTARLAALCDGWREGTYRVASRSVEEYSLTFNVWPQYTRVDLYMGDELFGLRRGSLVTSYASVLRAVVREHWESIVFGPSCEMSARNFPYARVRPPRQWQIVDSSSLVDLIDARYAARVGNAAGAAALRAGELPGGAGREQIGDVTIIRWASDADMESDEAFTARLSAREQWLAASLDAPIAKGWNADGEVETVPVAAVPHSPLTLYSPPLTVGYKAVHTAAGADAVREELRRVGGWIKQKQLEDGTPLSDVILILDSREAAHALRQPALAEGVRHLVYVGEDERMWNPFPAGEWL